MTFPRFLLPTILILFAAAPDDAAQAGGTLDIQRGRTVLDREKERQNGTRLRPLGVKAGSFRLYPSQTLLLTWNDNLYATEHGRYSDIIATVSGRMTVRSEWKRHALGWSLDGNAVDYRLRDKDDHTNGASRLRGRIDLRRDLSAHLGLGWRMAHEDRGAPDAASGEVPTRWDTTDTEARLVWRPGKVAAAWRTGVRHLDYKDVDRMQDLGRINNDDRDRLELTSDARLALELREGTEAFVRAGVTAVRYRTGITGNDASENRDSQGFEAVVGSELDFTGALSGEAFAGVIKRNWADPDFKDVLTPTLGAALRWNMTPLTSLEADLLRTVEETTKVGSPAYVSDRLALGLAHEFRRALVAEVKGSAFSNRYHGIGRTEDTWQIAAGLRYRLDRHFAGGVEWRYRHKDANLPGGEYKQNRVIFRVSVRL